MANKTSGINLIGLRVTDRVTGFIGTVMGHVTYISGCCQVLVQPKVGSDGKMPESMWIDEQRFEIDGSAARIVLENGAAPGFDKAPPVR